MQLQAGQFMLPNRKRLSQFAILFWILLVPSAESAEPVAALPPPDKPWFAKATALPPATGEIIRVGNVRELLEAAGQIKPGGTILVADGAYDLTERVDLHADNVTLRGESGQRNKVVLDGGGRLGEIVSVTGCSGVTIADLTIQNGKWNGFKVNADKGVQRLTIRNCVIHNIWQRGIKSVGGTKPPTDATRPADCRVQYCLFYNDRAKQFSDDEADRPDNFKGNYVGGMDVMFAVRWTISDNAFIGIHGRTGEARGAIFLWMDARDCIVERNVIVDCDSGICLGNAFRRKDVPVHATGCIVRNNFVTRCPENGIFVDSTRDCRILHNTIQDPSSRMQRLIRAAHANPGLVVASNLVSGTSIQVAPSDEVKLEANAIGDVTAAFIAPIEGNLRLRAGAGAIATVPRRDDVPEDIDGRLRRATTLVGAHQPQ